MLKREITFENFDGETVTETHHFHLTEAELITYIGDHEAGGGLEVVLRRITEARDVATLLAEMKKIILLAYGVRPIDNPNQFMKTPELAEKFSWNLAYSALFTELAMDADAAADFIIGALPRALSRSVAEEHAKTTTESTLPPPPPPSV